MVLDIELTRVRNHVPQLKTLVDLASKVWYSNVQLMDFVAKVQTSRLSPDLRFTWVQEPVKFEDAVGRILPVPSEYTGRVSNVIFLSQNAHYH